MIKGIGIDLVDKSRIKNIHSKHGIRFENKILSLKELEELSKRNDSNKISYLSNNFACKEACSKVLGKGFTNVLRFSDSSNHNITKALKLKIIIYFLSYHS